MALFYAYLKDRKHDGCYRYLITFVNREAADEWWRMKSTSPSPHAGNIKRISPQFYTAQNPNEIVNEFPGKLPGAEQFLERMFFTLLHDRDSRVLTTAPPIKITDHISGRWYFIRSQADPRRHWYFRIDGACLVCKDENCSIIHVSTEYRTRFSVRVRNIANLGYRAPKDVVMIGGDEISIAASKDYVLRIDDAEELKATKTRGLSDLLFDDLKNRFVARAAKQEDSDALWESVSTVERGLGEAWELVD